MLFDIYFPFENCFTISQKTCQHLKQINRFILWKQFAYERYYKLARMAVMVDREDEEGQTIMIRNKRFKFIIPMTPAAFEQLDSRKHICQSSTCTFVAER